MAQVAGMKLIKNSKGKVTHVTLSVKKHGKLLEDIIDAAEMEKARKEESIPWEIVKEKLDKKFGFKD